VASVDAATTLVRELVAAWSGRSPLSVEHLPYGHNSTSFDVGLRGGAHVIVRTHADPDVFRWTLHNLEILKSLGLPVPHVLFHDLEASRYPFAYLVLERFPGRDLGYELPSMTPAQMEAVAEAVMDAQARVRELPSAGGYGYVGIGEPGNRGRWGNVLDDIMALTERTLAPHFAPSATDVREALEREQHYFASVSPTCFLDDLTTKNVIVDEGELSGFVDFDCVCYGDPLLHLGLTQTAVTSDADERSLHYVHALFELASLTAGERRIVDLYSALFGVEFLRDRPERNEWSARLVGAIDGWLKA
jgi:aminoglycoside phosphotransferase (APT) family kinase protein